MGRERSEPREGFTGLPAAGFALFRIPDRRARREAILEQIHPALRALGEELRGRLETPWPLHLHLPRLDWPRGYEPFCTWLVLSAHRQGYQAGPQLNVGVHADHVAVRLGWDVEAAGFGRFEFLCRYGGLGEQMAELARQHGLSFRVYAGAAWPEGARLVYASAADWPGAFEQARRHGNWFELGRRYELPEALELVTSRSFLEEAARVLGALCPLYARIVGGEPGGEEPAP